jgi:hypothetical protein
MAAGLNPCHPPCHPACHHPRLCTGDAVRNKPPIRTILLACLVLLVPSLALLQGCDDKAAAGVESVKLGSTWFHLEVAETQEKRFHGLSDRTEIAADGGMIFLFARAQPLQFVMRDCPIPIDIIFVDGSGRIVALHQMKTEEPRRPDEPKTEDPSQDKYENRLVRYPSRFAAQFVIELKGGALPSLGLKEGDKLPLDADRLKAMAK